MKFDKIMVAVDFNSPSVSAFDFAAHEAKMQGAKVCLINVLESNRIPPDLQRRVWTPGGLEKMEKNYLASGKEALDDLAQEFMHGIDVESIVMVSGDAPGTVVARYAAENDFQLIVAAAKGKGSIGHFFIGSTVQKLIASAPCPVMIFPIDN